MNYSELLEDDKTLTELYNKWYPLVDGSERQIKIGLKYLAKTKNKLPDNEDELEIAICKGEILTDKVYIEVDGDLWIEVIK